MVSDEDGDPGDDQRSDKDTGGEQEEPLSVTAPEERENGAEEFIDEEHESQFCLETNFTEEEEETDRAPEHKDSTGRIGHDNQKDLQISLDYNPRLKSWLCSSLSLLVERG